MKYRITLFLILFLGVFAFADKQTIILVESDLPYTSQTCFANIDANEINTEIKSNWDNGWNITSVAYTANGWFVVMSDNSEITGQTFKFCRDWPSDWINENWHKGFYITSLAYSGSTWLVVMSQDERFFGQTYNCESGENLEKWIKEQWDDSYNITSAAYRANNEWIVIMSRVNFIGSQSFHIFSDNIKNKIQNKAWDNDRNIQILNYGEGHYFLVTCNYLKNNDRRQRYIIQPTNLSKFINESFDDDSQLVAFVGGGYGNANYAPTETITATRHPKETQPKNLASLTWLTNDLTSRQKNYSLKVGVKSDSKIENVKVYVNNELDRGIIPVNNDGFDMTINRTLSLALGDNRIKVIVTNHDGETVLERTVIYDPVKQDSPTDQQRRIALVMGNSRYKEVDKRLKNPANDATDLARKLENLGFTVILSLDQTQQEMESSINNFAQQVRNYDVALFYYAGHGMRSEGFNYLIPTDAVLADESDIKYRCINANLILDKMDKANCPMKIVILDACRNNPFTRSWNRGVENEGLGTMIAPKGTFIAFSTAPGEVAQDGTGKNSPYTAALLQTLDKPNLSITDFFQEVLEKVATETKEKQTPWTSNSFRGKFYFNQQ